MTIRRFEDLKAWQMARELARMVYEVSRRPRELRELPTDYVVNSSNSDVVIQPSSQTD